jgi:hypothetical protein
MVLGGFALFCVALAWPLHGLEVRAEDGCGLFLPLREGETVELVWRHSVDGIEVRDRFARGGERLYLIASEAPYFASGLGEVAGRGRVVDAGDHALAIIGIRESVDPLPLRVGGPAVGHRLRHRGREYALSRRFAGERVMLEVRRRPLVFAWSCSFVSGA